MPGDPGAVENSKREAREPAHVNLVEGQASGGDDQIVVGELHGRQLHSPIVLAFVDELSQHLGHCVVNALHTTVTAWMVGAGGDVSKTKKLIYCVPKIGAELEAVVREDATWVPPKGNVPVDKDVDRAFSCKFGGGDGEHVRTTSETVDEEQNIGVTPGRDRQWPKISHDGPTNRQTRRLPRLALQAMAQPPAGVHADPYPPIETLEYAKFACCAEMARSSRMTG